MEIDATDVISCLVSMVMMMMFCLFFGDACLSVIGSENHLEKI